MSRKTSCCSYLATFLWSSFTGTSNEMYNGHYWGLLHSKTKELMSCDSLMYTGSLCFADLTCNHFLNTFVTPQFSLCCHIHIFASGERIIHDERYNIYWEHFWFCTSFALKGWFLPSKTSFLHKATKKGSKLYHNYLHVIIIPTLRLKKLTVRLSDLLEVIQEACSFLKPCTIFNFRKLVSFNRL